MNLEMEVTEEMIAIACDVAPHFCCLVSEKLQEVTVESGLDVAGPPDKLCHAVTCLSAAAIQVSLFIDADERQIAAAGDVGSPYLEIHTCAYADATDEVSRLAKFARILQGSDFAVKLVLKVNAGHRLDYHNVKPVTALTQMQELKIGHSIMSRAVIVGLADAVRDMKRLMREARN